MPRETDYLRNPCQYSREDYTTSTPEGDVQAISSAPGYLPELLDLRQQVSVLDGLWLRCQAQRCLGINGKELVDILPSSLSLGFWDVHPEGYALAAP